MSDWDFPKSSRLLNSTEYTFVFDHATVKINHRHVLILACPNQHNRARLGLVVAKKHCRSAVRRNRIKRRIRETFRQQQHNLNNFDAIVLPRSGADRLSDSALNQLLDNQWRRLADRCPKST